ncbi:MAG: glycine betaine ABC transporter substrate-binding protein [Microbacteriaceae bacterium]|nr:glycine betaine ABC transporter substrate-binding protein [Microbacteriaceae bacterium]
MKKRTAAYATAVVSVLALSACSSAATTPPAATAPSVAAESNSELTGLTGVIGAKDFAEQYILAYLTTDLLNAHGANTTANIKLVGSANVRTALESDNFMGYWEYTGTSWITYNKNTAPVKGEAAQYDAVKAADAKKGIAWLAPAPLNNTYAFATLSTTAQKLGVKSLSDVAKLPAKDQTFCIESEFSTRDDGWPGLKKAYGITVADANVSLLDTGVIYTATQKGTPCNFGEVFQTDGRIKALGLTVMADDLQFFPVYQGGFTMKQSTLDKYPAIATIMAKMSPKLTTAVMQTLNAKADVDGDDPKTIAHDWLVEEGLLK